MGQSASGIACGSFQAQEDEDEEEDEEAKAAAAADEEGKKEEKEIKLLSELQTKKKKDEEKEEEEEEGEKDYTSWLPDECLAWVFEKMSAQDRTRCSLVCKRFLLVEAHARERLTLRAHASIISDLPSIFTRFDHITKLCLRAEHRKSGMGTSNTICDKGLLIVAIHCTSLSKLKLKGCKQITDSGIELFARARGSSLKKLAFGSCNFGARGVNAIIGNCRSLEELTLKRLRGLVDAPVELIGPGCASIRRICLKDLLNAQLFGPLIAGSRNLRTLIVSRSSGNWDKLLEIITQHLPNLGELHMERLHLSDRGLRAVAKCANLEALYVIKTPECTNHGLLAIADGCKHLKKVHVDGWKSSRIGDEGLIALAMKCKDIQELVLIGINATSTSLDLIVSNCSGLERLALCNSDTVGDVELSCIAHKAHSLKRLCVKGCAISDEGMRSLATGCPRLIKAKIKKCRGVTWEIASWLQVHRPLLLLSLDSEISPPPPPSGDGETREGTRIVGEEGTELISESVIFPICPSARSRFAKFKLALIASRSFIASALFGWSSSNDSCSNQ